MRRGEGDAARIVLVGGGLTGLTLATGLGASGT
jgi:2-polyprenyl-6-methoxyphenol hydroxylase-like FAD-dependent oxidoreductase